MVSSGTGKAAQVGDEFIWGKTGTTENYGDAWFVGGNDDITVAIWVGYADKLQPMEFEHAGGPVAGGTYPAEIFHDFMTAWLEMRTERRLARGLDADDENTETAPAVPVAPTDVPPAEQAAPTETAPADEDGGQRAHPGAQPAAAATRAGPRAGTHAGPAHQPPAHRRRRRRRAPALRARRPGRASRRATGARRAGCPRRRSARAAPRPS